MCWTLTSRALQRIMPSFNGSSRTWNAAWLLSSSRQDLVLAVCHAKSHFVAFCHNGKLAWSVSAAGFVSSAQMLDVPQGFDECTNVGATFKLLESFDDLVERDAINADMERKHAELVRNFLFELQEASGLLAGGQMWV